METFRRNVSTGGGGDCMWVVGGSGQLLRMGRFWALSPSPSPKSLGEGSVDLIGCGRQVVAPGF